MGHIKKIMNEFSCSKSPNITMFFVCTNITNYLNYLNLSTERQILKHSKVAI